MANTQRPADQSGLYWTEQDEANAMLDQALDHETAPKLPLSLLCNPVFAQFFAAEAEQYEEPYETWAEWKHDAETIASAFEQWLKANT